MAERTSHLDVPEYRQLCTWAAGPGFDQFRQHVPMFEGDRPVITGFQSAILILRWYPELLKYVEMFRSIDSQGNPWTYDYPVFGKFSPNTLRYVKILGEILELVGPLDGKSIAEIGGGFGGQCVSIMSVSRPASYTIIDLPETLSLQDRFLKSVGVATVKCLPEPPDQEWDIVISNWALTECARDVQEDYLRRVLLRSKAGFMFWSHIGLNGMEAREMASRLPNAEILAEDPLTLEGNSLIVWGHNRDTVAAKRLVLAPKKGLNILGVSKQS